MEIQTLKSGRIKKIVIGVVVFCLVASAIILRTTKAKYKTTQSINIAKGVINYSPFDIMIDGIFLGDGEVESIPNTGYELNTTKSYCTKSGEALTGITIQYDIQTKTLALSNYNQKGVKCYLYFDEQKNAKDVIIANAGLGSGTPNFAKTSCSSGCGEATVGLYQAEDDDGVSYYFRGNVNNNWVKFAGFYWRIIRINGDGTIRLIYSGTSATTTGTGTQLDSESKFNTNYNDNMYVGYMYTYGQVHGLGSSSTIKGVLDSWYESNLASYESFIDTDAGFCGDRTPYTSSIGMLQGGGVGTTETYYAAYIRLVTNKKPSFKCSNSSDLYTLSSSSKGNKALTKPIGLITADEVAYAGGVYNANNTSYYLYTKQYYWTMSPCYVYSDGSAGVFCVSTSGLLDLDYSVGSACGVRPVINLKADTVFATGGTGTSGNPYVVV